VECSDGFWWVHPPRAGALGQGEEGKTTRIITALFRHMDQEPKGAILSWALLHRAVLSIGKLSMARQKVAPRDVRSSILGVWYGNHGEELEVALPTNPQVSLPNAVMGRYTDSLSALPFVARGRKPRTGGTFDAWEGTFDGTTLTGVVTTRADPVTGSLGLPLRLVFTPPGILRGQVPTRGGQQRTSEFTLSKDPVDLIGPPSQEGLSVCHDFTIWKVTNEMVVKHDQDRSTLGHG
jgi:hypothetical protein